MVFVEFERGSKLHENTRDILKVVANVTTQQNGNLSIIKAKGLGSERGKKILKIP